MSVRDVLSSALSALCAPTGGASIGNTPTATVTIAADDITCEPCVADATTLCVAKTYSNPVGNFASFGDINALATCP